MAYPLLSLVLLVALCYAVADLTTPPLILIQTHFQGFSGRGNSSAMALVDSGASYNFMLSALAKSLGWRITPAAMHVRLANGEK